MAHATTDAPQHTNRLTKETSPYLLQHQHNPVDWYPWGEEAFEASRRENKPIFLSVGYSTCYWCHVMERQSFENPAVAKEMNDRFINIKVDREERPDVDQLYMTAVQVLTRHGGWPMSVWLMPDLRPFYGGTYFPPEDSHGRPGFVTVLRALEDAYTNRKDDVEKTATQLKGILEQLAEPTPPTAPISIDRRFIDAQVERSTSDYEPTYGGFGSAPKFPRETLLELLLVYCADPKVDAKRKAPVRKKLLHTLDALAAGGIRDQLGGGFHRYSTDAKWLVPHFEIMLYDNAMLGWCYVEAFRQTEDRKHAQVAREIFDFVLREMTSPQGSFYTAFDAEVDGQEGLNYLWTADEIEHVLGADDAKVFNRVYGVDRGPNFADPHHGNGVPEKNILYIAVPLESEAMNARLAGMRQKLYDARQLRKQPLLDTKILTSWNALMIRAMAYGGKILQEPHYLDAAAAGARFLLKNHRMPDGGLYRTSRQSSMQSSRDGGAKYNGFLDDYAFLCEALLALHDARADGDWKSEADAIFTVMERKFGDPDDGGFYFSDETATDLIVRQKYAGDSPLPSGNAIAATAALALGRPDVARRTLGVFAGQMQQNGEGMSSMIEAALLLLQQHEPFTVTLATASADRPASPSEIAANVVSMRAAWVSPTQLNVHLDVLDGFHINAHDAGKELVPTSLAVSRGPDVAGIDYPPGEEQRFAFADEPIRVYDNTVLIAVRFTSTPSPEDVLQLSLTYQACDDSACLAPVTKRVELRND
ncbi:MAG: DUF255 domain-containing protein [Planctomycetota bacterium]|nr:DUF255 domain-containing protein [Planctomycetota bacterium]